MLTKTKRPPTDDERAIMAQWRKASRPSIGELGCHFLMVGPIAAIIGAMVGGIIGISVPGLATHIGNAILLGGGLGLALAIPYTIVQAWNRNRSMRLPGEDADVKILHCIPSVVIYVDCDMDYDEDMSPAYALQVEEKTIVFLSEVIIECESEEGYFPCRELTIVLTADDRVLHVECQGEPLPLAGTYMVKQESELIPQSFDIVKGTLDKLPSILKKYGTQAGRTISS